MIIFDLYIFLLYLKDVYVYNKEKTICQSHKEKQLQDIKTNSRYTTKSSI